MRVEDSADRGPLGDGGFRGADDPSTVCVQAACCVVAVQCVLLQAVAGIFRPGPILPHFDSGDCSR